MKQKDILLCTLNSTYQHSAFGLRYLFANMGELQDSTLILEWTIKENSYRIVEKILELKPKIVGFSVYIWNTDKTLEVLKILKKIAPSVIVVLGGPEISYETEQQEHIKWCDSIIKGEADLAFPELCRNILLGAKKIETKVISAALPPIHEIVLPYDHYSDSDIKNRVIYVEASRGCP